MLLITTMIFIILIKPSLIGLINNADYNNRVNTIIISDGSEEALLAASILNIDKSKLISFSTISYKILNSYDTIVFLGHGNGKVSCDVDLSKVNSTIPIELFSCSSDKQPELNIVKGNIYKRKILNIEFFYLSF